MNLHMLTHLSLLIVSAKIYSNGGSFNGFNCTESVNEKSYKEYKLITYKIFETDS